jgi:hypothetical protein
VHAARCASRRSGGDAEPPALGAVSRSGGGGHAVCETVCFADEQLDAGRAAVFVTELRRALPPELRLLARIPVRPAFHAAKACEWWRYEALIPVSALLRAGGGGGGGMAVRFGFDNANFRPMPQKRCRKPAKGAAEAAPAPPPPPPLDPDQKALFGRLKVALKAFVGRRDFRALLDAPGGGEAKSGSAYHHVLHCYCRGILPDPSPAPGPERGPAGGAAAEEYACISICTELEAPARLLRGILGLAAGVARGDLPPEYIVACVDQRATVGDAAAALGVPRVPALCLYTAECAYDQFEASCADQLGGLQLRVRYRAEGGGGGGAGGEGGGSGARDGAQPAQVPHHLPWRQQQLDVMASRLRIQAHICRAEAIACWDDAPRSAAAAAGDDFRSVRQWSEFEFQPERVARMASDLEAVLASRAAAAAAPTAAPPLEEGDQQQQQQQPPEQPEQADLDEGLLSLFHPHSCLYVE